LGCKTQHSQADVMIAGFTNDRQGWRKCSKWYGIIAAPAYKLKRWGNMKQFNFSKAGVIAIFFAITQIGMMTEAKAHAENASADVIHACMAIKTGIVRIVPATGKCKKNESVLHWAITGATGPAGPVGLQGPSGAAAPAGLTTQHFIGETYGGGKVFFVYDDGQHGLIAALFDQPSVSWRNSTITSTFAQGDGIGEGRMNTAIIIAAQASNDTNDFAARAATRYRKLEDGVTSCQGTQAVETCLGDWYLPSKAELNLMYQQKGVIGGFTEIVYWSSSETDANTAWTQWFSDGFQATDIKSATLGVRAVRAF
jgi:hypothetical protein